MKGHRMKDWSAKQYLKFEDERSRPARDLVARIPLDKPRKVVDIACGTLNWFVYRLERCPAASVTGIDTAQDMTAKAIYRLPRLHFTIADVTGYEADTQTHVRFSNALFKWLRNHFEQ